MQSGAVVAGAFANGFKGEQLSPGIHYLVTER
jgi:hypothetical protein